jgi:Na+-driven multidrug efflux pump
MFQLSILGFSAIVGLYGTAAFTACGIGISILSLSVVLGLGFAVSAGALVGQCIGAGEPERARRTAWSAVTEAAVVMSGIGLLLGLGARAIGSAFIAEAPVVEYLAVLVVILALAQPLIGIEFSLSGALRGAGDTKSPAIIGLTGLILGRGLFALAVYLLDLDAQWLFGAILIDYSIKAGLYLVVFQRGSWQTIFAETRARTEAAGAAVPPEVSSAAATG